MIQLYAILDCDHKKMNNLQLPQKDREREKERAYERIFH